MTSEHTKCGRPLLIAIMFVLVFSAWAFAKGSDPVSPFPVVDARAWLQRSSAMVVDSVGNIIVAGYSYNGTNNDYAVVKFKADGTGLVWGPVIYNGNADDVATAVAVDSANNIIVTGTTWNGTNNDIRTIKYDGATGAELWVATYNSGGADAATAIAVDASNDIYVAGYSFNGTSRDDFLIIKYPAAGSIPPTLTPPTWVEQSDDTGVYANNDNRILAITAGSGGIAVTGYSSKGGADFDIVTRKYGFDKTLVREWRYASSGSGDDRGIAVKMDSSGNVIVTGFVISTSNNTDIYTAKYNPASSTLVWEKTHDGNDNDEPKGLWVDTSGDVYVTGYTTTLAGNQDFFTARYAGSDGTLIWKSVFDDGNGATDIPVGIVVDSAADGGVFVTGYTNVSTNEDYISLKYSKDNGNLLWDKSWNGPGNNNDRPVGIALEPSTAPNPRNVIVAGWTYGATNGYDFAAIKYDFGALNAPSDLIATAASNTSITLSWVDNSLNEDRFFIQRKLGETGTFADINPTVPATLSANTVTYTDAGLTANNYYYYRVRAYNAANDDSYYSNEARALTKVVSYDNPIWTYLYIGADNNIDRATAITVGSDDHPVVTGYSVLREVEADPLSITFDYMTIKLDRADASIKWKARFDSEDGGDDQAEGVMLDNVGNALVTGTATLFGTTGKSDDLYTIKYDTATYSDPAGTTTPPVIWADQYGTDSGVDKAIAIEVVHDASNNSVVIGYGGNASSNTDIFIIKYSADGSRSWTPIVYDSGRHDYPTGLALDSSGDIFVSGYSFDANDTFAVPTGSYDWFTAKYSGATGVLIWFETYNVSSVNFGGANRNDQALSIDVDAAGDAFVTGYATNSAGDTVFYTVKYKGDAVTNGVRIWEKYFNYPGYHADAVALKIDPIDGAVVVAGSAYVSATDSDFHLIRYNSLDGTVIKDINFDKPDSYDYATAMTLDSSGYIYIAGNIRGGVDTDSAFDNSSDIMSIIYDYEGSFLGALKFDGTAHKQDEAEAITVNYQGEAFIAGFSTNAADNSDYAVVKHKNNYILVPAPLTVTSQPDYTKMDLVWRANTSGTSFSLERTPGPSTPSSIWAVIASPASGTTTYTDSGLTAGTNYCYRIDAYSGSLNSRKIEKCAYSTLPATTLSLLAVDSATQITLGWTQVTDNSGYKIERKIGAGEWVVLAITTTDVISYIDSGLTPGTLHYYRVSTKNADGFSTPSEQSASTKPAAPTQNAPTGITSTQVTVNWTNVVGETGYKIERKTTGSWAQVSGTIGADVLTYTDTTAESNTQYYYRIIATNASGDSDYSGEQGALSLFTSTTLSSAVGSSSTQIDLAWTAVSGATGYSIEISNCNYNNGDNDVNVCNSSSSYFISNFATYFGAWTPLANVGSGTLTYQHTGLTSGYAYIYRILANTTGNSSAPSNVIIGWANMTAPVLIITPASETSLAPSWTNINGATNYTLERKLGSGASWPGVDVAGAVGMGASTTSYTNTGLALSTEYCYRVKAYSTLPNPPPSIYSNELCATTPLAAPVLNDPIVVSTTQIDLSWNDVPGNTGYEIQRCNTNYPGNPGYLASYGNNPANDSWFWTCSSIIARPQGSVSYSDTALLPGYTYRYKIRDTYAGGTSAYSASKDTITKPSTPTLTAAAASATQMNLSWNDVNGDTGFKLEWKARSGADCTAGSWSVPITTGESVTTYSQTAELIAATYYCYRIYAYNAYSQSDYSSVVQQTTALNPPTLNTPTGITASKVDLSWDNVTGNTGYLIERKTGAEGSWSQVGTVGQNVITFSNGSGIGPGTLYYYRIKAQNAGGASSPSNEQSTITTPIATAHTVSTISSSQIDLSWPVVPGATNFKVERKTGVDAYTEITNVAADYSTSYCGYFYPTVSCATLSAAVSGYHDSGLTENTNYCYRVASWNSSGGDSAYSTEKCATTSAMSSQNLSAAAVNSAKIRLDWTPVACVPNACDNPDGFEIERQVRSGNWVNLKVVDGVTLSYIDTIAIEPNKQYSYRIRTFKGADKSPDSNIAYVTTPLYSADSLTCP